MHVLGSNMTETSGCFYSVSQICRARFAFVSILANIHVECFWAKHDKTCLSKRFKSELSGAMYASRLSSLLRVNRIKKNARGIAGRIPQ
ncbi:hypothetical protein BCR44DRAFT_1430330 [Catenaria anguillulae PL171]|uniref:Uncharacterized protein n=1 Tax=Catenaria anguillulae PL171 TaxID=765915 RepID=A0A1Y2HSD8_9FUNG|nr:hypothetical protein BCR44DRAFT_1430330 [Catenaria anguillulae PL171]